MSDNNGKEIVAQAERLFAARQQLDQFWDELASNFMPEMADFISDFQMGEDFAAHLADASPVLARRDLGDSLGSMLRPSSQPWFECIVEDEPAPPAGSLEALWLEFQTERTRNILYSKKSQFVRAMKAADHMFALFGNAVVSVTEGRHPTDILFKTWHLRDVAWRDDMIGEARTFYRKAKPTVRQLEQMFGAKVLPAEMQSSLAKEPHREVKAIHCVMPAKEYDPGLKPEGGRKWEYVSVWVLCEQEAILRQRYNPDRIYTAARWHRPADACYAISPAAIAALPNARMIQRMATTVISAAEKSVDPPTVVKGEKTKVGVDMAAGTLIYIDPDYDERNGEAIKPLDLGKNVNIGKDMMAYTLQQIERAFYLNKLALPTAQAKTAYETARLVEQYVRDALPLFEPCETEYLDPILDSAVSFNLRVGAYGPASEIPPGLAGKEIGFQYNNPLRQALRQQTVKAFTDTTAILSQAAALDQTAGDHVDLPKAMRDAIGAVGASDGWIRPIEEVEQIQQLRAEQQAQAAAAQSEQAMPGQEAQEPPAPIDDVLAAGDAGAELGLAA